MVKAADMAHMTDSQLCDFRFGRLPSGMTKGFAFPQWKEIPVGDPAAMYQRMVAANRAPHSAAKPPSDLANRVDAVVQAAREHNLQFYKAQLQFNGKAVTFVLMDIIRCARSSYMERFPPILYRAAFEDDDLNRAIPSDIGGYGEVAIWHGNFPVLLTSFHRWMTGLGYPENIVDLGNLMRKPQGSWPNGASFTGGNLCSFTINKNGTITNGR